MSLEHQAQRAIDAAKAEERLSYRQRARTRRKAFLKIEDLATHPEVNLAVEQLAVLWNVEVQTVRKWIRAGSLPGFRVGRVLRVKRVDALAYETAQRLGVAV